METAASPLLEPHKFAKLPTFAQLPTLLDLCLRNCSARAPVQLLLRITCDTSWAGKGRSARPGCQQSARAAIADGHCLLPNYKPVPHP